MFVLRMEKEVILTKYADISNLIFTSVCVSKILECFPIVYTVFRIRANEFDGIF